MKAALLIAFFLFALFCAYIWAYTKGYVGFPGEKKPVPYAEARPVKESDPYREPSTEPIDPEIDDSPQKGEAAFVPLDGMISLEEGIEVIADPTAPIESSSTATSSDPIDLVSIDIPSTISVSGEGEIAIDEIDILSWEERPDMDASSIPDVSVSTAVIFDDMEIQVDIPSATVAEDSPVVIGSDEPLLEEANAPKMEITTDELEALRKSLRAAQAQAEKEEADYRPGQ